MGKQLSDEDLEVLRRLRRAVGRRKRIGYMRKLRVFKWK